MSNEKAVASRHDDVTALLVCEKTAAKLIGVSVAMLVAGRFRKRPLMPFVRVGSRAIRYRLADINDFIDRNTVTSADCRPPNLAQVGQPAKAKPDCAPSGNAAGSSMPEIPEFLRRPG